MFKRAILEAFNWSLKWYLGSFSTAVVTFFFFEIYLKFERTSSFGFGIALILLTFIFRAIFKYITKKDELEKLENKKEKKKLLTINNFYGEAIIILKDIFAKTHYARKNNKIDKNELTEILVFLCNKLKELFEKRFKHNYSVCIKVLGPEVSLTEIDPQTQVSTLCRDYNSWKIRSQPPIKHNIFANSCFFEIFYSIEDVSKAHYLNNDLTEDRYYKNTSFQIYGELPENITTHQERKDNWKLPYKSELVVPITPLEIEAEKRKHNFLGYLCVDCSDEDAFHSKYDTQMLKGVADGIYDLIKLHTQNK